MKTHSRITMPIVVLIAILITIPILFEDFSYEISWVKRVTYLTPDRQHIIKETFPYISCGYPTNH